MGPTKRVSGASAAFYACAALSLLTAAIFWPARHYEFQAYDDQRYVAANPAVGAGLTRQGLAWAFGFHVSNWHPLTWISHMLDVQLFGMSAGAHHLVNVCLHIANTTLLLLVLKRMTGALWRSTFVAALFALHPMHVESVAWIAERKDVLSTFFFMLTLWAYAGYVQSKVQSPKSKVQSQAPKVQGPKSNVKDQRPERISSKPQKTEWLSYWFAILFYTLGLLSKPMLVTLPFVLLLLDYWPLQRFKIKNQKSAINDSLPLLWEKVPFFVLAIGSSVVTFLAQRGGGAVASLQLFSFEERIANVLAAYAGYLEKLIWPANLAVLYLPPAHWPLSYLVMVALLIAGITGLGVWQRHRRPYLIVGWLWFLGTLVPVIGLVQVGSQYMADRYTYVPFIGCFICLAWGGWDFVKSQTPKMESAERISPSRSARGAEPLNGKNASRLGWPARGVIWASSLLLIGTAAAATKNQLEYWRSPDSLFRHCIKVTTQNYVAYNNLGAILANQGKYDEAKPLYTEALRINSSFSDTWMNMGSLLVLQGDTTNAVEYLQQAIRLAPKSAEGYGKLALALSQLGRMADAVSAYRESLLLGPNQVPACNNLAWILATHPDSQLRNGGEAVRLAEHACRLTNYKQALLVGTLAAAYAEEGRFSDATNMADKAIELANASGQDEIARKNLELKQLYSAGKACREAPK
jgi:Flp pilus assembly protein TadD